VTHATITRCSQPLVGAPPATKRSRDDENYIATILTDLRSMPLLIWKGGDGVGREDERGRHLGGGVTTGGKVCREE